VTGNGLDYLLWLEIIVVRMRDFGEISELRAGSIKDDRP
jgi:hypothetical protein